MKCRCLDGEGGLSLGILLRGPSGSPLSGGLAQNAPRARFVEPSSRVLAFLPRTKKAPIGRLFMHGGEGGIRTLEACYSLHP
jgi:hypothetical protein